MVLLAILPSSQNGPNSHLVRPEVPSRPRRSSLPQFSLPSPPDEPRLPFSSQASISLVGPQKRAGGAFRPAALRRPDSGRCFPRHIGFCFVFLFSSSPRFYRASPCPTLSQKSFRASFFVFPRCAPATDASALFPFFLFPIRF